MESPPAVQTSPNVVELPKGKAGRPRGVADTQKAAKNRREDLTPAELEEVDGLVRDSALKSTMAKRGLALDYVMHGRLLAQIEARAKEDASLLDDPKHQNAAVSNRRRILETLKVVAAKEEGLGSLVPSPAPAPAPPALPLRKGDRSLATTLPLPTTPEPFARSLSQPVAPAQPVRPSELFD